MIRLTLALTAILALVDACAQDRMAPERALYDCISRATGFRCPSRKGTIPKYFTYKHAVIYCQCRIDTQWDELQEPLCQAITRACELGDI
jgi:hypothetical protein